MPGWLPVVGVMHYVRWSIDWHRGSQSHGLTMHHPLVLFLSQALESHFHYPSR